MTTIPGMGFLFGKAGGWRQDWVSFGHGGQPAHEDATAHEPHDGEEEAVRGVLHARHVPAKTIRNEDTGGV